MAVLTLALKKPLMMVDYVSSNLSNKMSISSANNDFVNF